jgi:hypothetical protein
MQSIAIVLMCVAAAISYGIVHDQITARLCVEYFTIGHPPLIQTESVTLLATFWGVVATWWVGAILGVLLALAARAGKRPKQSASALAGPIVRLLVMIAVIAAMAGGIGWILARQKFVVLHEPLASRVPEEQHVRFLVALWMHSASYAAGAIGGLILMVRTWRRRGRRPAVSIPITENA